VDAELGYEAFRATFEQELTADVSMFNEYHALIVHHAKRVCRSRPRCVECLLADECLRKNL